MITGKTPILVHNEGGVDPDPDKILYRFGAGPETAEGLAADAARAEAHEFPHGVSTMSKLPPRIAKSGEYRSASAGEIEGAGFKVKKTGNNPNHYTVELPKPVADEHATALNRVFGCR